MKKLVASSLLLLVALPQLFAQAPKSSLLWEISGNGLTAPSYLFGTFHIMCKPDFVVSDSLKAKLKRTRQFYGELKMDDPGMQLQLATKMIMKDKTLEDLAGADDYKIMSDAFLKITKMPLSMFNRFKPFMSQSLLTVNLLPCDDKVQPESEFVELAKQYDLPVLGLETVDDELAAIDKMPLDSQVRDLKKILLHPDSARREMMKLIDTYKKRNIDSVYAYIAKESNDKFERDLIITRNRNWLPVMVKAIKEKPSFFAVGAGHLGGANGVISLLRKQGYKLRPLTY